MTTSNQNAVADKLTVLLSDSMVLYTKARNFHWNITGSNFFTLHDFFEKQYDTLAEEIDNIAEQIRILGLNTIGSMDQFLKYATIKETTTNTLSAKQMLEIFLNDEETYIANIQKTLQNEHIKANESVMDLLVGILTAHEKTTWMIKAYLS